MVTRWAVGGSRLGAREGVLRPQVAAQWGAEAKWRCRRCYTHRRCAALCLFGLCDGMHGLSEAEEHPAPF